MFLVSSNPRKLKELARYGLELDLRPGDDLPEVDGTPLEVAIHKAKLAGPGAVVEDTVVIVDGTPWVDIRWTTQALKEHAGAPVTWQVTLAHNDGQAIHLFVGQVQGAIVCPAVVRAEAFGFDPFVLPEGFSLTLDELEQQGRKDEVSARKRAAQALVANLPTQSIPLAAVGQWTGRWQGSPKP